MAKQTLANVRKKDTKQEYVWQGKNIQSSEVSGELVASNITNAKAELRRQGIVVKSIKRKRKPIFTRRQKAISNQDICIFSRQLATMLTAGIPLVQSLDIVARGHTNQLMQVMLQHIKQDIESGRTLSNALGNHPKYFNALFINLVNAGEQSGTLDIMLSKIATYQEKSETLRRKIKKAMMYPTAVLVIALFVTAGLLLYVVPQFQSLFKGFGADLPAITLFVVSLSDFFQSYWWLMLACMIGIVVGFASLIKKSESFAYAVDGLLLKLPILGNILRKAAIARFSRTLAITFAAGLPLIDALKSVSGTTGNLLYKKATLNIRDEVETGQPIQSALRSTKLFPNMVIQMVAIGEESGSLESMLSKVADFYEEEVDVAVDGLSSLIEPIIMSVLGVLIGGLVIAMYLPIFKLGSVV